MDTGMPGYQQEKGSKSIVLVLDDAKDIQGLTVRHRLEGP
jgi:hypothetical protein